MKIKRRAFLILGSLWGLSSYINAQVTSSFQIEFKEVEKTLYAVQDHLFPEGGHLPSAQAMYVTKFLYDTMHHHSFDKDIKAFVIEGAKELQKREKGKFNMMSSKEKEKALRAYEETRYGSSWLSRIMTLSMEGMFSDPIYGSNTQEKGWKALGYYGSFPRPKTKYLES
jgi:hypothetical protein